MWSGQQTLSSLDQSLQKVRRQVQDLDSQVQGTSRQLVVLEQEEARCYLQLARLRLDQLVTGELITGIDAADRRVQELLTAREEALQNLQTRIDGLQQKQTELDSRRDSLRRVADEAAETLDKAEAATQKRLQEDPAHQQQLAAAHAADGIARQAETKTEQAEADRREKGRPYEADPLFMYLWERGYTTSRYSANPLTRFLDKKVARLCKYQAARPNYAMLLDIPLRLKEHARQVRAAADQAFAALEAMEAAAAQADGIPALRKAVEQAEQELGEIDVRIGQEEQNYHKLMQARTRFAAGEDRHFTEALATLAAEFKRQGIYTLRYQAEATSTAEDDLIVRKLAELDQRKEQQKEALARHKLVHERHLGRLQELEGVRHKFKRQGFDDMYSSFNDTGLLTTIMSEFLRGLASSDDLWSTLLRQQQYRRTRANPDFGSGGFGRTRKVWRLPSSRRGGGFRGGIGSRGRGGFRTGGGF